MSGYEPLLIIDSTSFNNKKESLEKASYREEDMDRAMAFGFLVDSEYKINKTNFKDVEFFICQPEGTGFNSLVRNILGEYNIYFKEVIL